MDSAYFNFLPLSPFQAARFSFIRDLGCLVRQIPRETQTPHTRTSTWHASLYPSSPRSALCHRVVMEWLVVSSQNSNGEVLTPSLIYWKMGLLWRSARWNEVFRVDPWPMRITVLTRRDPRESPAPAFYLLSSTTRRTGKGKVGRCLPLSQPDRVGLLVSYHQSPELPESPSLWKPRNLQASVTAAPSG